MKRLFIIVLLLFTALFIISCGNTFEHHRDNGHKYYDQEKWDQAIQEYTAALELDTVNVEVLGSRGSAYTYKGMYNEAINDLTKAIELEPDNVLPYYNRSQTYIHMGEYDKAIADCDKIIELGLEWHFNYYNRAVAYSRKGKEYFGYAMNDFLKAKSLTTNAVFNSRVDEAIRELKNAMQEEGQI